LPGFDAEGISLFKIHTHVDRNGFVYVNMDANLEPEVSWEEQYGALDRQNVLIESGIDWSMVEYDFTWTEEGEYNWKLMQDNYNECYHCLTAHPAVAKTTNLDTYFVTPGPEDAAFISHFNEPKATTLSEFDETRFQGRSATHVFPIGHFSPNPGVFHHPQYPSCVTCSAVLTTSTNLYCVKLMYHRNWIHASHACMPHWTNKHATGVRRLQAQHSKCHSC
jgi:phenylpropionate dioxygenase-like ring-hydroxylating dioxygenase large terminal subunit